MPARYHTFADDEPGEWDLRGAQSLFESLDVGGKSLLDVGCRDGWFSELFTDRGALVTSLDVYDSPYRSARCEFLHKNAFELAYGTPKRYDIVFCGDMIQHVENPLGLLRALHHVCRERLYLTTDVDVSMTNECRAHCVEVPLCWGSRFIIDMMRVARWTLPREIGRFTLDSDEYESRTVALYTAIRDWQFELLDLQLDCHTQVGDYIGKGLR